MFVEHDRTGHLIIKVPHPITGEAGGGQWAEIDCELWLTVGLSGGMLPARFTGKELGASPYGIRGAPLKFPAPCSLLLGLSGREGGNCILL